MLECLKAEPECQGRRPEPECRGPFNKARSRELENLITGKCCSCYILLTDQIPSLLLEVLGNMRIAIVSFLGFDFIAFEINLIFLIKPFFYMMKKSTQKL